MPYSAGSFQLFTPGNPVVTGTTIATVWANSTLTDIGTGLSTCVLKDGTQTITANITFSGFKATNLGAATLVSDAARASQVQNSSFTSLTSVAGTNTITATATPTPAAYVVGQVFEGIAANTNTGAATLDISSLGAGAVQLAGTALAGGELVANSPFRVFVSAATPVFQILANGQSSTPAGSIIDFGGSSVPAGWLECDASAVSRTTYARLFAAISTTWGAGDGSTTFNLPPSAGRTRIGRGTGTVAETVAAGSVSTGSDNFTVTSNSAKWITGQPVILTTTGGLPAGLSLLTTYFLIRASATTIQFATTLANAQSGTAIDITTQGTGNHTVTGTLTARTLGEQGGEETHAMSLTEMLAHTHPSTPTQVITTFNGTNADEAVGAAGSFATLTVQSRGGNVAMNNMQPFAVYMTIIKT